MTILYTEEQYNVSKFRDFLPLKCDTCGKKFLRTKRHIYTFKTRNYCFHRCSKKCQNKGQVTLQKVTCKQCGKEFKRKPAVIKKSSNHFCGHSCACTYQNTHKTKGIRRSKLEVWLETRLPVLYPNLEFHFNRKDAIKSELDIYIPSLKLAFELNGIFHYEPIFGEARLGKIQNNDQRKFQACIEKEISLCIIDVSQQKYFKEQTSQKYLDIISNIIQQNLSH